MSVKLLKNYRNSSKKAQKIRVIGKKSAIRRCYPNSRWLCSIYVVILWGRLFNFLYSIFDEDAVLWHSNQLLAVQVKNVLML